MAFAVPHFRGCSGELNLAPRAYPHSGLTIEADRLDPAAHARPACAARRRPGAGGGRLARRQRAAALGLRGRRHGARLGQCGGFGVGAARPGGRRRGHWPRLQPAGLHAHVPCDHGQAQGAGQAGGVSRAVRPRAAACGRGMSMPSTTCSPRLCTAFGTPTTIGPAGLVQAAPEVRSACPRWCVNALGTTAFIPASSLPGPGEVGPHVTLWQPAHGGDGGSSARAAARARARHAGARGRLAQPVRTAHFAARARKIAAWTTSLNRRLPSGPTCRTATAGSASIARGNWYMRATTARSPRALFTTAKGSMLRAREADRLHPAQFHDRDAEGQWFFQNGPRRRSMSNWRPRLSSGALPTTRTLPSLPTPGSRSTPSRPACSMSWVASTSQRPLGSGWSIRRMRGSPPKPWSRAGGRRRQCTRADLPQRFGDALSPAARRLAAMAK